ncbi:carbohydrate-binding protein [Clostridium sp. D33t1_170424_F3]|uniref:carbohydrate-binding protein n=1 Tax=Clostridium sp. D33t1_170424_F3 TaxID=2787099 RepID=UPI0018AB017A|nr:carbohydrate-binding protein [Clostridium sp. D33t1_170424_F3]
MFDRESLIAEARRIRAGIEAMSAFVPDELAVTVPTLFPAWISEGHEYTIGDRVQYGGSLYRCLTAHTSQASWTPDAASSLWVHIDDPAVEWPEWRQPAGSTDAYTKGAKVSHNGKHWTSDVDANVWEPPTQWTEVPAE